MPSGARRPVAPAYPIRRLAVALLVITMVTGGAKAQTAARPSSEAPLGRERTAGRVAAQQAARRSFAHARHEALSCRECHGAGALHRTYLVRSPSECAACHHDPGRAPTCTTCHAPETLPALRQIETSMRLPPPGGTRTRILDFRHRLHLAPRAGLTCGDCHRADVLLRADRPCASCHGSHHAATADCRSCHADAKGGVHQASVHLSCAGSGCHASGATPAPSTSRTLCLVCHAAQRDHEPNGVCASCHRIPGGESLPPPDPSGALHGRARRGQRGDR